jgi:hypothetical protein
MTLNNIEQGTPNVEVNQELKKFAVQKNRGADLPAQPH